MRHSYILFLYHSNNHSYFPIFFRKTKPKLTIFLQIVKVLFSYNQSICYLDEQVNKAVNMHPDLLRDWNVWFFCCFFFAELHVLL